MFHRSVKSILIMSSNFIENNTDSIIYLGIRNISNQDKIIVAHARRASAAFSSAFSA